MNKSKWRNLQKERLGRLQKLEVSEDGSQVDGLIKAISDTPGKAGYAHQAGAS